MGHDTLTSCTLCPHKCHATRTPETGNGFCRMGTDAVVSRIAPHHWEEPCISGTRGTGAVFFAGCTLRCAHCQNYRISHEGYGQRVSPAALSDRMRALVDQGVHSISLITGTHFVPTILAALSLWQPPVTVVWNSSGYELPETIQALAGHVQVFLPDIKHVSARLSGLLAGAPDYFVYVAQAVKAMCEQAGPPEFDADGILTSGTLVRHLVLPGCTTDSIRVLDFIADELPPGTHVSLMRQYTPQPTCTVKGMDRPVTDREYQRVATHMAALGLPGYVQGADAAQTRYTPAFDLTGI